MGNSLGGRNQKGQNGSRLHSRGSSREPAHANFQNGSEAEPGDSECNALVSTVTKVIWDTSQCATST